MKKILFVLAFLPMILFSACSSSDDDDNDVASSYVGTWVEKTNVTLEVFHYQFNSNGTGFHWATDNGIIDKHGKSPITWAVSGSKMTINYSASDIAEFVCSFNNGELTMVYDGETITYTKQ